MAILKPKALILTLFLFSTLAFAIRSPLPEAGASDEMTQLLSNHGLPPGLFPNTVYRVQAENDGRMTVNLQEDCYVHLQSGVLLHYTPTITGVMVDGAINNLIGVDLQQASGWAAVTAMTYNVPNDQMVFSLGEVTPVLLPMTDFAFVPPCQVFRNDWTLKIRSVTDAEV